MLLAGTCLQLLAIALSRGVIASPTPNAPPQVVLSSPTQQNQARRLHGKFLHITDFHPDDFYKAHTATEDGISCHRGKGPAGVYGAEKTECDSPFSLVNATFQWLQDHVKDEVDFVIWTGDTARHDSDEKHPRTASEVIDTNRIVADQFIDTFSSSKGKLAIPIVPTFGNNDFLPHNIFYPGPNKWLHNYGSVWKRFIPEDQFHSFQFGGWFHVDVIPGKLAVFSLNTMYFFDRNAGVDGCADPRQPGYQHMEWLRIQLQRMRDSNMKAILMGHVPPARTDSKQNWDETCWQKYTLWLKQYRDVVTGSVYGHMNIDHFLLQDTKEIDLSIASTKSSSSDETAEDISVLSKGDYLSSLRDVWSSLPSTVGRALAEEDEAGTSADTETMRRKKKNKFRKIGGPYAERYQLSLVSPSVVPNYLPTLRIISYNITGLEDTPIWSDTYNDASSSLQSASLDTGNEIENEETTVRDELKRDSNHAFDEMVKKGKNKKPKKPNDPNLIIPDGPPKKSPPGPAYLAQPLTFTGYVQYFANITFLNNGPVINGDEAESKRPKPRPFAYDVLYSTFDDKMYRLPDMTVKSYLKLAYRIGLAEDREGKKGSESAAFDRDDDDENEEEGEEEEEEEKDLSIDASAEASDEEQLGGEEPDAEAQGGKKHKKKKKKKKKHGGKVNKLWLHFLRHAFVGTASEEELKDY